MNDADAMIAWLRAQWDADAEAAGRAGGEPCDVWAARGHTLDLDQSEVRMHPAAADHIARHDPRDTAARLGAERRIAELYESARRRERRPGAGGALVADAYARALRALAYGYRHRPGWQRAWRP